MFQLFGKQHLLTLGLLFSCGCLLTWGCRKPEKRQSRWLGWGLALALAGYTAVVYIQKAIAGELSWKYALPLELCHWVMVAVVLALVHKCQLSSEIAYFWGAAGTLQAIVTPDISSGFPSWEFILFFWSHGATLLAILFLIVGHRFQPRSGSVWRMLIAINFYSAFVGAFNALFDCNYGYLCRKPAGRSLLDYLGPWPWYLVSLEFIALTSFWLLDLPWRILRYRSGSHRFSEESQSRLDSR